MPASLNLEANSSTKSKLHTYLLCYWRAGNCKSYRSTGDFNLEASYINKEVTYEIYHEEGAAVTLVALSLQVAGVLSERWNFVWLIPVVEAVV